VCAADSQYFAEVVNAMSGFEEERDVSGHVYHLSVSGGRFRHFIRKKALSFKVTVS
jgi:hypothetical protein